jgi:hypothetical protein
MKNETLKITGMAFGVLAVVVVATVIIIGANGIDYRDALSKVLLP